MYADMRKFALILLVSAMSVFLLWTMTNICDITSLFGGLTTEKQMVTFPERTSHNDTRQNVKFTTVNESVEEMSDEMCKLLKIQRNKMEPTRIIKNKGEHVVEKEQSLKMESSGRTMRNDTKINLVETEPTPGDKHIIFIETGCFLNESRNSKYLGLLLNKRQVCAIESAAKMNPDYKVYLLYSCPIHGILEDSNEYVQTIFTYPNVYLWKVEIKRHFSKTPLGKWSFNAAIMSSVWPKEHASDVLRLLTPWKYGGIYLDMDFIILR